MRSILIMVVLLSINHSSYACIPESKTVEGEIIILTKADVYESVHQCSESYLSGDIIWKPSEKQIRAIERRLFESMEKLQGYEEKKHLPILLAKKKGFKRYYIGLGNKERPLVRGFYISSLSEEVCLKNSGVEFNYYLKTNEITYYPISKI